MQQYSKTAAWFASEVPAAKAVGCSAEGPQFAYSHRSAEGPQFACSQLILALTKNKSAVSWRPWIYPKSWALWSTNTLHIADLWCGLIVRQHKIDRLSKRFMLKNIMRVTLRWIRGSRQKPKLLTVWHEILCTKRCETVSCHGKPKAFLWTTAFNSLALCVAKTLF